MSVLQGLRDGLAVKEIADKLNVGEATVRTRIIRTPISIPPTSHLSRNGGGPSRSETTTQTTARMCRKVHK